MTIGNNMQQKDEYRQEIAVKTAGILLEIGAVSFRFDPPYTFTSGLKSPIYLDNRIIMSYPKERRQIVLHYIEIIKNEIGLTNIDYISGTASAAIPQAAWIAGELDLPLVYVRPTTKSYGKGNKLEGDLKKGSRVLIVEDHISTAASVVGNAETVRELGSAVVGCVATTTYETKESIAALQQYDVKLYSLTNGKIIVDEAMKKGAISEAEKAIVDKWFHDPASWSTS